MTKKILILPGDGIGQEVCEALLPLFSMLNLPVDLEFGQIGWECWKNEGNPVPQATWDQIDRSDAVLLGAITSKPKAEAEAALPADLQGIGHKFVSPVIQLRQKLQLFANVRPASNVLGRGEDFRMAVIRENTEGLYSGYDYYGIPTELRGLVTHPNVDVYGPDNASCTIRLQTRFGMERLFRFAFDHARDNGFDKVTFADKPNVMRESGAFAKEILEEISAEYPTINHEIHNVDAMALWLVRRPERFGVIVAENMFGDILSDLAGGVMGGLGLAPSGNYGNSIAYFEPVHGSAPSMAGQNKANPAAIFMTAAMMFDNLGFDKEAALVTNAVRDCVRGTGPKTYDLGGDATSQEFAGRILTQIEHALDQCVAV